MNKTKVFEDSQLIYNKARSILWKYTKIPIQDLYPIKSELNFIEGDKVYITNLFL